MNNLSKMFQFILLIAALAFISLETQPLPLQSIFEETIQKLNDIFDQSKEAIALSPNTISQINNVSDFYNQFMSNARLQRDIFEQNANEIIYESFDHMGETNVKLNTLLINNNMSGINLSSTIDVTLREYVDFLRNELDVFIQTLEQEPLIVDQNNHLLSLKEAYQQEQAKRILPITTKREEKTKAKESMLDKFKNKLQSAAKEFVGIAQSKITEEWEKTKEKLYEELKKSSTQIGKEILNEIDQELTGGYFSNENKK